MIKLLRILFVTFALLVFNSCILHSTDNLEVEGDNITLLIDRPTIGIVGVNEENWPNLDEALNDLYTQFKYNTSFINKYPNYNINVRLRNKVIDKYGNENYEYQQSHFLVSVPADEIEKYQSVSYMDKGLELSTKIREIVDQSTTVLHLNK